MMDALSEELQEFLRRLAVTPEWQMMKDFC